MVNFDCERNTALGLLLPQTSFVVRGGIPQRVFNWERSNMKLNTALELLLPRTHFTARGSIPQHISLDKVTTASATLRWSYFCLRHISWPEVAVPNIPNLHWNYRISECIW